MLANLIVILIIAALSAGACAKIIIDREMVSNVPVAPTAGLVSLFTAVRGRIVNVEYKR